MAQPDNINKVSKTNRLEGFMGASSLCLNNSGKNLINPQTKHHKQIKTLKSSTCLEKAHCAPMQIGELSTRLANQNSLSSNSPRQAINQTIPRYEHPSPTGC